MQTTRVPARWTAVPEVCGLAKNGDLRVKNVSQIGGEILPRMNVDDADQTKNLTTENKDRVIW